MINTSSQTKNGSRSRAVPDCIHNNMSLQTKKQTSSLSRTNSFQTTNRLPEPNGPEPHTLIIGFKQKPGSRSRKVPDRIQNQLALKQKEETGSGAQRSRTANAQLVSGQKNLLPEPDGPGPYIQTKNTSSKQKIGSRSQKKHKQTKDKKTQGKVTFIQTLAV